MSYRPMVPSSSHEDHLTQYGAGAAVPPASPLEPQRGPHYGDYTSARLKEIELLKSQLDKMEAEYSKAQTTCGNTQAYFEAYKESQKERDLQLVYYKQHVYTVSKQLDILSKRVADFNQKERELNELRARAGQGGAENGAEGSGKEKSLRSALESMSSQVEAYIEEIDELSQSFDDIQEHNGKLLQQLTEQSDCQVKLRAQLLRQEKEVSNLKRETLLRDQRRDHEKELYDNKEKELREVEKRCNVMELKWQQGARTVQEKDKAQRELEAREARLKQRVEALEGELQSVQARQASAYDKKRRLEGDASVHGGAEDGSRGASSKDIVRDQQIKHYQKLLFCSICKTNEKKMIIKRCLHMFCDECISTSLQSRNRKCPACGVKFSQSDLVPIYF